MSWYELGGINAWLPLVLILRCPFRNPPGAFFISISLRVKECSSCMLLALGYELEIIQHSTALLKLLSSITTSIERCLPR